MSVHSVGVSHAMIIIITIVGICAIVSIALNCVCTSRSYGAVYKDKYDQLPCAAKVLHPTILNPNDPRSWKDFNRSVVSLEAFDTQILCNTLA